MRKAILLLTALVLVTAIAVPGFAGARPEAVVDELRVGVVFSIGGLGDESFNDAAYRGIQQAVEDFDIIFDFVEPDDVAEMEDHQRAFVEAGYDLVIAIGFLQQSGLESVAMDFPDARLAIVDSVIDMPNVASLIFKEHEGSFLVGALAAMMSESGTVGFVGGMEVPVIHNFQTGFEQGVAYADPDVDVLINYAGAFNDPGRGKELAISQNARGADIVYHAAGGTGMGVFEAAKEGGFYAIGVDSDQDHLAPGTILTSMLKRVDVAVYNIVADLVEGQFSGGVHAFGVADGGVGTTDFTHTANIIPQQVRDRLEQIKAQIIDGTINVASAHD
ncbi:MAG: BMP family ABC transporter substrate-binding protein [Spirochaetaceae bacterium]|nr:MAG: BMP family ABC transporter substrate-binding protein [Spirochaetaceae bacterium]